MIELDCAVVGAGIVGLACGRALAQAGLSVAVFEQYRQIGQGVSSRSSEVIHAGLYYPTGSLKARLCVTGRAALVAYCTARGVPFAQPGKLVVAPTLAELPRLEALAAQARANGVPDIQLIDGAAAHRMEPAIRCVAALHSPHTGIVDSHALMQALADDLEAAGGLLLREAPVTGGRCTTHGAELAVGGREPYSVSARWVINAAGLGAQALAGALEGFPAAAIPPRHLVKGHYFALQGKAPFSHLIYPIPEPGGLGIHLTLDLADSARFGPDVQEVDTEDYAVSAERGAHFVEAIRPYWPDIDATRLAPAYAGIRPKLSAPEAPAADFRLDGPAQHGMPGLIQLFGIESPGLTAALAIADEVRRMVAA